MMIDNGTIIWTVIIFVAGWMCTTSIKYSNKDDK